MEGSAEGRSTARFAGSELQGQLDTNRNVWVGRPAGQRLTRGHRHGASGEAVSRA